MTEANTPQSEAEAILAERLVREPRFDQASLERLCGEFPNLATPLRAAFAALDVVNDALRPFAAMTDAAGDDPDARVLTDVPFEDRGELGRGGMGVVRHVYDPELRRELAVKVLRAGRVADPRARLRFFEEAQVTSQLDHPGIVPVHSAGEDAASRPYFTMKLVRGRDLGAVFTDVAAGRDGWTVTRAVAVLLRVCEAVDYAHRKGVVHRDLKPSNIMVGPFGEVFVMDWGLAKLAGRADADLRSVRTDLANDIPESPLLTGRGEVVGTPYYMAPEQALGRAEAIGTHSDIYAVGAILYHLLAGQPPYHDSAGSDSNKVWHLAKAGPPPPLHKLVKDAHPELVAICNRAMARTLEARYVTMAELRADLSAWIEGRVVHAYERGWWAAARKWVRRNRMLASLAALLLVAIPLIGGLWKFAQAQSLQAARSRIFRYREELSEAQRTAALIHPAWPENIPALAAWLQQRAAPLAAAIPEVQRALTAIEPDVVAGEPLAVFLRDTYQRLITDLGEFDDPESGLHADVRRRLEWARKVQSESIDRHRARWDEARAAIERADGITASTLYRESQVRLEPELDLVPIGMNPRTKLWEFHHLPSAGENPGMPVHDADGHIAIGTDTGIIFVLVPGGRFVMGADLDPKSPHYDPMAEPSEAPAHEVTLRPFFIARHELTLMQWHRLRGKLITGGFEAATWPITQIPFDEANTVLGRHALVLPTEAQWEYAARAGTTTPYWCGGDTASLQGVANIADQSARRSDGGQWWPGLEESFDDGVVVGAPADGMRANAFGLHHVHGNASEYVRDALASYKTSLPRPGDGLRGTESTPMKLLRGGNFSSPARRTRSSFRGTAFGSQGLSGVGMRAARLLGIDRMSKSYVAPPPTFVRWDGNGHHYGIIDVLLSWEQARTDAESHSLQGVQGHLATITSQEENDFIADHLRTANAWLGGYQDPHRPDYAEPGGGWAWVTGEPFAFQCWGDCNGAQPNNLYLGGLSDSGVDPPIGQAEDVILFWDIQASRWNDVPNHPRVRQPYVIEFDTTDRSGGTK